MLLGVGQAPAAEFGDAAVVAQGVHHVVQGLARRAVHLHVAAGHQGQLQVTRQALQVAVAAQLVVAQQVTHADPHAVPAQARELSAIAAHRLAGLIRQPDEQAALQVEDHVAQGQLVLALGAAPAAEADQARQLGIGSPRRRQGNQVDTLRQMKLAADDKVQVVFLRRHVRLDYPGQGALVRDSQPRVAICRCLRHQLLRARGATQEAEAGQAVEFGVGGGGRHGNGVTASPARRAVKSRSSSRP